MNNLEDTKQPTPAPPPFKIKFLDVFCEIYISLYVFILSVALHNRNYKTEYFVKYYDQLNIFTDMEGKYLIIVISIILWVCIFYLIFRYGNYIKMYKPELHYKMNYDQDFMEKRIKKRQQIFFIMMIIIPPLIWLI